MPSYYLYHSKIYFSPGICSEMSHHRRGYQLKVHRLVQPAPRKAPGIVSIYQLEHALIKQGCHQHQRHPWRSRLQRSQCTRLDSISRAIWGMHLGTLAVVKGA